MDRVYLYDSTLRDGAQSRDVDFSVSDKQAIALALDAFGIDYIEGGWPGANPRDDTFFAKPPSLKQARLTAFGMTRRHGRSVDNDPGIAGLREANTQQVCIVGKAWDFHIEKALEITPEDNAAMIADTVRYFVAQGREVLFDAEHFFDGYKHNAEIALRMALAAYEAGARWIVLCDTNGGSMPHQISEIVQEVTQHIPGERLGIHCHNDTEQAVANSIAAVLAGVRQCRARSTGSGSGAATPPDFRDSHPDAQAWL